MDQEGGHSSRVTVAELQALSGCRLPGAVPRDLIVLVPQDVNKQLHKAGIVLPILQMSKTRFREVNAELVRGAARTSLIDRSVLSVTLHAAEVRTPGNHPHLLHLGPSRTQIS